MSGRVSIHTLWFWRKNEDGPELLLAWDDYSREQNEEGFEEACAAAYETVKSDDAGYEEDEVQDAIETLKNMSAGL